MRTAFDAKPDLVILDIMLPGFSGLDILEELRKRRADVPVLILSARGATRDKIGGLNLGADDYMAKPFDLPELIARVGAMLRRERVRRQAAPRLKLGTLVIEPSERTVSAAGRRIGLSAKEFDLLLLLASSPGQVFSRDAILERVWGWSYEGTARTVDNFVASLRKKFKAAGCSSPRIDTLPRVGYRISLSDSGVAG
jgi:DNA-binding response OmpR family regulator